MNSKILGRTIVLTVLMASATITSAQTLGPKSWSTAGSTGSVDKNDLNKIVYSDGIVSFPEAQGTQPATARALKLQLQTVQAVIRYNVSAVDGLFFDTGRLCMGTRFRDDGDRARVILRLVEFNLESGTATTRLTFDSNSPLILPQPAFQATTVFTDRFGFDFSHNAYYVEAVLTKQQPIVTPLGGGRPALAVIVLTQCKEF